MIVTSGQEGTVGLSSAVFVVPVCILLGEAIAWGMHRFALAEGEIAENAASIQQLFDLAPIGICKLALDGRFLEANLAFGEILGQPAADLVGRSMWELTHPDDRSTTGEVIARLVSGEVDRFNFEKRYLHADGQVVWASVNGSIVRDAQGHPQFLIGQIEDITERRELREQLARTAVTDPLTGLPNRKLFMEHLADALLRAESEGRHVALMFLDLDRFKLVNDGIGHDAGDRLLQRVGQRLLNALRDGDVLARFGGDEFTVLCEVADEDEAVEIVGRLRRAMATPVHEADFEQFVLAEHRGGPVHLGDDDAVAAPAQCRRRHVPGQAGRTGPVHDLRPPARRRGGPQPADLQRTPPGHPGRPTGPPLPAGGQRGPPHRDRHRGPGAVAAPDPAGSSRPPSSSTWPRSAA